MRTATTGNRAWAQFDCIDASDSAAPTPGQLVPGGVALGKVTEDLERLEMQRAAHNAMLLLTRIQDFEQRALERRRQSFGLLIARPIVAALLLLLGYEMLAPLTPHIAEELWSLAGNRTLLAATEWPREVAIEEAPVEEEEVITEAAPEEAAM